MHEALLECAADLFRLIDAGLGEAREAHELRDLIRYYFGEMPKAEKDQVLREVYTMRWGEAQK